MKNTACIILAAGLGTRMKSELPKVLHKIYGRPMIDYPLELVESLKLKPVYIVAGHGIELLKKHLKDTDVELIRQRKLLGTADAVNAARERLAKFTGNIVILYADTPLISESTLKKLIRTHTGSDAACTILTATVKDPTGFGRIVRDDSDNISKIVEEQDAPPYVKAIEEINTGVYCFEARSLFDAVQKVTPDNKKREYYLTDTVHILARMNKRIASVSVDDADEIIGINDRQDLAKAHNLIRKRTLNRLMDEGVSILDPDTTHIHPTAKIGRDTVIYPFTVIERDVQIGKDCSVGPFARIRPNTSLADGVQVGNFVEINRSNVADSTRVRHQAYLGDAVVGKGVNIGAGTITANYDGKQKYKTYISDGAFVGCGTIFVAPVKMGAGAVTGAGCVVTREKDVPPNTVVVGMPAHVLKGVKGVKGVRGKRRYSRSKKRG